MLVYFRDGSAETIAQASDPRTKSAIILHGGKVIML